MKLNDLNYDIHVGQVFGLFTQGHCLFCKPHLCYLTHHWFYYLAKQKKKKPRVLEWCEVLGVKVSGAGF